MKINIVYREERGWFVGHIQEYPDYESQGKTLQELRDNLIEIYDDIRKAPRYFVWVIYVSNIDKLYSYTSILEPKTVG